MQKVWEQNFWYDFFKPYIVWATRTSYSKITVKGAENIPDQSKNSVIFTANHCCTMMDSLVLLQARKEMMFFVARADIFKKKFFATLLLRMRIMPIYRHRDCDNTSARNAPVFKNIVEAMEHGGALSIHPEGTHDPRRTLLPFKKGTFFIAQQAANSNPDRPMYIVPAGLEYTHYFECMRPVTLTFGEPVRIYGNEDSEAITEELQNRVSKLITWFPDDEELPQREKEYNEKLKPRYGTAHKVLAAFLLPFWIIAGFLCSPILIATGLITRNLKDKAWLNTIRYSCKLALTPFITIGAAIAGFIHLPWYLAVLLIIAALYAHPVFYRILAFYKDLR